MSPKSFTICRTKCHVSWRCGLQGIVDQKSKQGAVQRATNLLNQRRRRWCKWGQLLGVSRLRRRLRHVNWQRRSIGRLWSVCQTGGNAEVALSREKPSGIISVLGLFHTFLPDVFILIAYAAHLVTSRLVPEKESTRLMVPTQKGSAHK